MFYHYLEFLEIFTFLEIDNYYHDNNVFSQCFGIAEGGQVKDMKNMAKAAGQSLPEFTPPEGETIEQVK